MVDRLEPPTCRAANAPQGSDETGGFGRDTVAWTGAAAQPASSDAEQRQALVCARIAMIALACRVMKRSSCPICKGPREPVGKNPTYPFCGPRCKLADLSNWLSEGYTVEGEPVATDSNDAEQGSNTLH
jgi:endogenous inhibitor of DNA gyrase (YacG/DUF329 family)